MEEHETRRRRARYKTWKSTRQDVEAHETGRGGARDKTWKSARLDVEEHETRRGRARDMAWRSTRTDVEEHETRRGGARDQTDACGTARFGSTHWGERAMNQRPKMLRWGGVSYHLPYERLHARDLSLPYSHGRALRNRHIKKPSVRF